jgi:hypothetical protein
MTGAVLFDASLLILSPPNRPAILVQILVQILVHEISRKRGRPRDDSNVRPTV